MKYLNKIWMICLGVLVFASCKDEDSIYNIPDPLSGGTVKATVIDEFSFLNFQDLATASYQFEVEAFDFQGGELVASLEITATYTDVSDDSTYARVDIVTVTSFPSRVVITSQEFAAVWGFDISQFGGGDLIDLTFSRINMKDGRVFENNDEEINPNKITDGTCFEADARGTCFLSTFVGCPIEAAFTGDYLLTTDPGGAGDVFFGGDKWTSEVVKVEALGPSPLDRTFVGSYITFSGITFNFTLLCGDVLVPVTGSGIGCGGPSLSWTTGATAAPFDPAVDDEIVINVMDLDNAGCGAPGGAYTLRLTKI